MTSSDEKLPFIPLSETNNFQDTCEKQVEDFAREHYFSSAEMFAAHELALGVAPTDIEMKERPRNEVYELAQMLKGFYDDGFAVSRIASLRDWLEVYERAPEELATKVTGLPLTQKEKDMLNSLVTKPRAGTLVVYKKTTGGGSKPLEQLTIPEPEKNDPFWSSAIAFNILNVLKNVGDEGIELTFEQ